MDRSPGHVPELWMFWRQVVALDHCGSAALVCNDRGAGRDAVVAPDGCHEPGHDRRVRLPHREVVVIGGVILLERGEDRWHREWCREWFRISARWQSRQGRGTCHPHHRYGHRSASEYADLHQISTRQLHGGLPLPLATWLRLNSVPRVGS